MWITIIIHSAMCVRAVAEAGGWQGPPPLQGNFTQPFPCIK